MALLQLSGPTLTQKNIVRLRPTPPRKRLDPGVIATSQSGDEDVSVD